MQVKYTCKIFCRKYNRSKKAKNVERLRKRRKNPKIRATLYELSVKERAYEENSDIFNNYGINNFNECIPCFSKKSDK